MGRLGLDLLGGDNGTCAHPPLAQQLFARRVRTLQRLLQLSPQQGDIVRLMLILPAADSTNKGIALVLGVRESTVGTKIGRLFKPLCLHSRMELAQRWTTRLRS